MSSFWRIPEGHPSRDQERQTNNNKDHEVVVDEDELDIPSAFLCPITLQIMKLPMLDPNSNHSFERATIVEWLNRGKEVNPLTRKRLRVSDLIPNHSLKKQIDAWKKENGLPIFSETSSSTASEVPWYRRKPSDEDEFYGRIPGITPLVNSPIYADNPFMLRLLEAQRRDAEFRQKMLSNFQWSGDHVLSTNHDSSSSNRSTYRNRDANRSAINYLRRFQDGHV